MDDKDFEKLKNAIKRKMNELSCLQFIYIKETGVSYILGGIDTEKIQDAAKTLKESIKG